MGMSLIFMFVIAVVLVLYILAYWMIFRKAGEAGWKALIPFYGTYIEYKLSYSFGHGVGYALGLTFLTPIFLLILAFDESVYIGPGGKKETDREMYL